MTVPTAAAAPFAGAGCAIAGSTPRALRTAERARKRTPTCAPSRSHDHDRAAYHAAASIAANFLVTLEHQAERLAATAGVPRELLVPLARAALENWAANGAEHALTGPVARGDEATIARQRQAIEERAPDLLDTFDALVAAIPGSGSHMRTIRTIAELRAHVRAQRHAGRSIGLVPTMGAFHAGHESLIRAARAQTDEVDRLPLRQPRAVQRPARPRRLPPRRAAATPRIAERLGADILFAPPPEEVYPAGFSTTVSVPGLSDVLEGAQRGPGHFAGVCTVVAKLFNMVEPDVAYFGQKDGQQVAVLKRMALDLDFPVRIEVLPTVREPDGLAMSSRNVRLSPEERAPRRRASSAALRAAADAIDDDPLAAGHAVLREHGVTPEYLAIVDPDTFQDRPGPLIVRRRHRRRHPPDRQRPHRQGGDPGTPGRRPERSRQCPPHP